jgi:hypothetical protein
MRARWSRALMSVVTENGCELTSPLALNGREVLRAAHASCYLGVAHSVEQTAEEA